MNYAALMPNEAVRLAWIKLGCPRDPSIVARLIELSGKISEKRELSRDSRRLTCNRRDVPAIT